MSGCSVTQGSAEPALTQVATVPACAICNRACRQFKPAVVSPEWGSIRHCSLSVNEELI